MGPAQFPARSPRGTERPAIVASSSYLKPAAWRSVLSWAPNDPGRPGFTAPSPYRRLYGRRAGPVWGLSVVAMSPFPHTGRMAVDAGATTFVTGAAGFIGTELVKGLVARGHRVFGLTPSIERRSAWRVDQVQLRKETCR
jgi:hypothetical protein